MPQAKSSSGSGTGRGSTSRTGRTTATRAGGSTGARKTAGRASPARKTTGRTTEAGKTAGRTTGARKTTAKATGARKTAARGGTARKTASRARAGGGQGRPATGAGSRAGDEALTATIVALREHLARGIVLTAERLQATLDDTVRRGRITRDDAEDLLQSLIDIGRRQTDEVLSDLEKIFGRRPGGGVAQAARDASRVAADRVGNTASRARRSQGADRVLREVDRARRATGLGSPFPITAYDSLSATQVSARLDDLTAPQLRKVRDYERRTENRKSVLDAVERRLADTTP
jgi:hypothetical protein